LAGSSVMRPGWGAMKMSGSALPPASAAVRICVSASRVPEYSILAPVFCCHDANAAVRPSASEAVSGPSMVTVLPLMSTAGAVVAAPPAVVAAAVEAEVVAAAVEAGVALAAVVDFELDGELSPPHA